MTESTTSITTQTPSSRPRRIRRFATAAVLVASVGGLLGGVASAHHGPGSFPDVVDPWYHHAVDWAAANGITNGKGNTGLFAPHDPTTRAEVVTFQHRYHEAFNPTQTLIASVNADGTPRHSGGVGVLSSNRAALGVYDVRFARPITEGTCWYQATPRTDLTVAAVSTTNAPDTVRVRIRSLTNAGAADGVFHLAVTCENAA